MSFYSHLGFVKERLRTFVKRGDTPEQRATADYITLIGKIGQALSAVPFIFNRKLQRRIKAASAIVKKYNP